MNFNIPKKLKKLVYNLHNKKWGYGYISARDHYVNKLLKDKGLLKRFENNKDLPNGYGLGFDERVVEFPWLLSKLPEKEVSLLDAGSTLNHKHILQHQVFKNKKIIISNLNVEQSNFNHLNISYLYDKFGDIRSSLIKSNYFDVVTCISVLEHVGMDNFKVYKKKNYVEKKSKDYKKTISEFKRILKKGGKCYITLPYGKYEDKKWLQQFDKKMIMSILKSFSNSNYTVYAYSSKKGWQLSSLDKAKNSYYFDVKSDITNPNQQLAAGAVVCIEGEV